MAVHDPMHDYRRIGSVLKPHGVDGSFLFFSETDFLDWVATRKQLIAQTASGLQTWHVIYARDHRETLILKVKEVTDRNQVEALRGVPLFVPEKDAMEACDDESFSYHSEIVGLEVHDRVHGNVGSVTMVLEVRDNTLLQVTSGERTFLVPFVQAIVLEVDSEGNRLMVDLPEGLMDLNP